MNMPPAPLRVLIAAPIYPPEIGGPATHAVLLEAEMPRRGIELSLCVFRDVRSYPKVLRHFIYAYLLWRRARRADLIYTLDPVSVGLPAYVASLLSGKPYVLRIGGDYAWEQGVQRFGITETLDEYLAGSGYRLPVRFLAGVQSFVARRARYVVAPSNYLAGVVAAWGVARERIVVAYSAPEPIEPYPREDARKALGVKEDAFLIASAARLVPWKGYERLIDALVRVREQIPSATLIIAGDGPYRSVLEAHVRSRGMGEAVRFAGRIPRDRIFELLSAADCFALNTRYEGLSHQILEAFMARVPVVTTSAGGNAEIVSDGVSGLIAPYNDAQRLAEALVRVASDRALSERLREGGDAILSRFSVKDSVDTIADTLKRAAYRL